MRITKNLSVILSATKKNPLVRRSKGGADSIGIGRTSLRMTVFRDTLMFSRSALLFFILLFSSNCVDPIVIESKQSEAKIVIDAFFTDNAEFNMVRISLSAPFSNNFPFVPFNAPVEGATVKVFSSDGLESFDFKETERGLHKTEAIGQAGKSYYVEVTLDDGTLYRSEIEEIDEPVNIESLFFTIDLETRIEESSGSFLEIKQHYFNVSATINDPSERKNYYLWKAYGTFEYFVMPIGDGPCECVCYAPLYPLLSTVNVVSDQYFNGGTFSKKVASIRYDRRTRFLTKLFQFSINKKAYEFWNKVYEQQSNVGSIFDPTPQQLKGNFYNKENRNEPVLGFFTTASVTTNKLLINRGVEADRMKIKESHLADIPRGNDCRPLYAGATDVKPIEFYD